MEIERKLQAVFHGYRLPLPQSKIHRNVLWRPSSFQQRDALFVVGGDLFPLVADHGHAFGDQRDLLAQVFDEGAGLSVQLLCGLRQILAYVLDSFACFVIQRLGLRTGLAVLPLCLVHQTLAHVFQKGFQLGIHGIAHGSSSGNPYSWPFVTESRASCWLGGAKKAFFVKREAARSKGCLDLSHASALAGLAI